MGDEVELDSATLTHRVVLLGVADLAAAGETPAHAGEVARTCNDALDAVEGEIVGRLTEPDVVPALRELEAEGFVDGIRENTSPTGKGRPRYYLDVDRSRLLDELADDARVAGVVDEVE